LNQTVFYFAILVISGIGWGLTMPLSKIAVSTGHQYFGLIAWQLVFGAIILFAINRFQGRGLPFGGRYLLRYGLIALLGTIIPNSASYQAAVHLPAGLLSILISLVPMFALPLALIVGMERFEPLRFLGVVCGAVAIVLIVGPKASLPDASLTFWVLIAAIAPLMYAFEGTWVARYGILDLDPVQLLLGASLVGLVFVVPLALVTGQWVDLVQPWAAPEYALLISSVIHALIYVVYVWLVGRAGSVFASQVAYLVTGSGVVWAILILSESYSAWIWAALGVMMLGLFLVRPR
jgi:drug/metabolite transporter (DMT)-like permease